MSTKTAMIRARTTPSLKQNVEHIFQKLGMTTTEAINLFYNQVKLYQGIPFMVKIPNKTTLQAMQDIEDNKDLTHAKDVDDLFKKTGVN